MERREIELNAYAKINLSLVVTGRREDGYHNIRSLMQGIDLCDVIRITKCPENGTKYNLPHCTIDGVVVYLCTDVETIPTDMSNLALKGVKAVLDEYRGNPGDTGNHGDPGCPGGQGDQSDQGNRGGQSDPSEQGDCGGQGDQSDQGNRGGQRDPGEQGDRDGRGGARELSKGMVVHIEKRLPVAAGIAGGSGNAAACMLGLNALLGNPMSLRGLMRVGARVGADVPFSLMMNAARNGDVLAGLEGLEEASTAAWIGGIGDIVDPAEPETWHVVMANPGIAVSTRAAYEAIDAIMAENTAEPERFPMFTNDLESYTLRDYPEAARLKRIMQRDLDADIVMMSGSGPTMIAYYKDKHRAEEGFARMLSICEKEQTWRTWMCTAM